MLTKIAQLRGEIKQRQDENLQQRHRTGEIIEVVKLELIKKKVTEQAKNQEGVRQTLNQGLE